MATHLQRVVAALWMLGTLDLALAQRPAWVPLDVNEYFDHELGAFEDHGGRPLGIWSQVLATSGHLLEWDGANWFRRAYATQPPVPTGGIGPGISKLAYDPMRAVTVLLSATSPPTTWEWDSVRWTQVMTPNTPPTTGCVSSLAWHGRPGAAEVLAVVAGQLWGYDGTDWRFRGNLPFNATTSVFVPTENLQLFALRSGPWLGSMVAWDGTNIVPVAFAGTATPDGRGAGGRIVFDEAGNRLVMADPRANQSRAGTLTRSGGNVTVTWTSLSLGLGSVLSGNLVYDRIRGRALWFGGYGNPFSASVLELTNGSTTWTRVLRMPDAPKPGARSAVDLAWDPQRQQAVMFGGSDATSEFLAETWTFDGRQWQGRGIDPSLLGRHSAALAWVGSRGETLMFGGATESAGSIAEMWRWNGSNWAPIGWTGPGPGPRYLHDMVWHEARNRVVLFGGTDGGAVVYGDTWEFDPQAQTWQQIGTPVAPPARNHGRMVYDAQRQRVVLFGGARLAVFDDTWAYSSPAGGWTQLAPAVRPPARWGHAMEYDPRRHRIVLHGGWGMVPCGGSLCPTMLGDHWEFDSTTWVNRPSGPATTPEMISTALPPPRAGGAMTFDARNQRFLLFGGHDGTTPRGDTWQFDSGSDTFTMGQASGGIGLRSRRPAIAGSTLALEFDNPSALGWLAIHLDTAPVPTHFVDPPLACSSRAWFFGLQPIVAGVGGDPGRLQFGLPPWTLGLGLTFQAIALDAPGLCLRVSDPLATTVRAP